MKSERKDPTKAEVTKWVAALRSGKYKQCKLQLNSANNEYCCLGVACDVFIPQDKITRTPYGSPLIMGFVPADQPEAPRWLKIINTDIVFTIAEEQVSPNDGKKYFISLSNLNDMFNYNFNEIADVLELIYIHKAIRLKHGQTQ